jgi:peptidase E
MKTQFLLHGGKLKYDNPKNTSFFEKLTTDLSDGDTILHIGFARREEADRQATYERDKAFILAHTDKNIEVINATYDTLIDGCRSSKAIFVTGGETDKLVKDIQKYSDFVNAISNKIIAGSSAGACLFSTYYYFNASKGVLKGLGVLPISLMVHYGNEEYNATDESLELLRKHSPETKLVTLNECEWKVFEI